ncbi:MAG TPA: N,N-dimethylformamidase beta subunit family domain-containing protein, partial [Candidatus Polarisedimenticolia bacterium]|nr:N,N-dimethylformamidase beta subunit family domain-containing protein [Candidatus Polarisedimenticolia bacterium]
MFGRDRRASTLSLLLLAGVLALIAFLPDVVMSFNSPRGAFTPQQDPCVDGTTIPVVAENCLPGNPPSEWDISGAGDASIQGFATDISVNRGETISFKINTPATLYHIDIYRLGYYQGNGARKVAGPIPPTATLPQSQPACLSDPTTRLLDCGNWAVSASWTVPAGATSGIYLAKLVRDDGVPGQSHIVFVVRDDDGGSEILFQTSDTTWQAYNQYAEASLTGGNSLYGGPGGQAYKVSYNRPFTTRSAPTEDWLFNAEYPMVRWLERNGYDVSYFTDVDSDRRGAEILEHRIFLSVGHDEYWSAAQRAAVEAARDAGVHLAFFSGNEVYWKVRWEDSIDGSGTPERTLVCYKEGTLGENNCGTKCDPLPDVWTGLWRDGCAFSPPADGCRPENSLSGQISWVGSTSAIEVPGTYSRMPFWRNTSIAALTPEESVTLPSGTLGYEWDFEQSAYAAFYPPLRLSLSSTTLGGNTHAMSLYRHPSGALVFGAGTVQWSWGLDSNHDRGSEPENVDMQQATVNLLADMGAQPETLQANLVAASSSTDSVAPTSSITYPADGATFDSGTPVVVTGTAADTGGDVVLVQVSTDGGATWNDAQGFESWTYNWVPGAPGAATLMSRAVDGSLNVETPGPGVALTIAPRTCPCSLWGDLALPTSAGHSDVQAIEVGVKFRTETDGYITGIRFFKTLTDTGTHVGNLWDAAGSLLATVTFAGEGASGWQEAAFDNPVPVTANTTYVASYHAPNGQYAFTSGYFQTAFDNPPLRALANGEDGPNGVYQYGAASAFPTQTYNSANYWVDVVYAETAVDSTPPTIAARVPAPGASGIAASTTVKAIFSEPVDGPTITMELRDALNNVVPSSVVYLAAARTATLTPDAALNPSETYTVSVGGAVDLAGNAMAGVDSWSFTTAAPPPPPPDEGPGGPILVVADATNPFGRYLAEILRTEGLNYFTVTDRSLLTPAILADHLVVLLGEMSLSPSDVTMLSDYVNGGGKLIAMRPDAQLAGLLGLTDLGATLPNAYVLIDTGTTAGAGLVGQTIQYHGPADLYTLNGAAPLATLFSDATTATPNPAVTLRSVGTNGGMVAAFAYDLARSVVYTRQGNPAWAGQERDGVSPIRPDDLFFGAAAADPQPDWIDLSKVAIPQADEQQRLLAQLIFGMSQEPLPRFWYFPSGRKAVVVMTGDQHGCCASTTTRFDTYVSQSPAGCSVDDWECVRASSYVYPGSGLTDAVALSYHNLGFELGVHVNTGCADFNPTTLESYYSGQLATFASQFPSLPVQDSERTHCIVWSDWATQPQIELAHGIRLDTNYYYWPGSWLQDRPGMFTGSGMPMRFADLDGTMIDVYQAVTQMTDESGQSYPFTIDSLLDRAVGPDGYYGAFTANMHMDSASHPGSDAIVASALARGVPVVSGRQMKEWLDGRNGSSYQSIAWDGSVLSFSIAVGQGAKNLRGMVPVLAPVGSLVGITRDGGAVSFTTETIKGIDYAFFDATAGNYEATYLPDTTAPTITNLTAVPSNDGTALVSWDTDEPGDSLVEYGTDPGALTLSVSQGLLVTAHALTLTGLAPNTIYYYRATSADGAANSATAPPPATDPPASFATPGPPCFEDTTV